MKDREITARVGAIVGAVRFAGLDKWAAMKAVTEGLNKLHAEIKPTEWWGDATEARRVAHRFNRKYSTACGFIVFVMDWSPFVIEASPIETTNRVKRKRP